jgi:hypothetical protein
VLPPRPPPQPKREVRGASQRPSPSRHPVVAPLLAGGAGPVRPARTVDILRWCPDLTSIRAFRVECGSCSRWPPLVGDSRWSSGSRVAGSRRTGRQGDRDSTTDTAAAVGAGDDGDPNDSHHQLHQQLQPVDALGRGGMPRTRASHVPTRAATTPTRMVSQIGMCCRPGRISRARAPMMAPMMIAEMTPVTVMILPSPSCWWCGRSRARSGGTCRGSLPFTGHDQM